MELKSPAFQNNQQIPDKCAYQRENLSPPLLWTDIPLDVKSFALVCDDPDAPGGDWVHWVLFNIPSSITSLEEGISEKALLSEGIRQGVSDFGKTGYGGPCPPPGKAHRYFFRIMALDVELTFSGPPTMKELIKAVKGHILAEAVLVGLYKR